MDEMQQIKADITKRRKIFGFFVILVIFVCFVFSLQSSVTSQSDEDLEKKINALLAQMTLEEKLGQLQQLDGHADGRYREEHVELIRKGQLGSTLNVRGAARTNELQRIAMEGS